MAAPATGAAEWRVGMHVWLPASDGSEQPFTPGQVTSIDKGSLEVTVGGARQMVDLQRAEVLAGNAPDTTAADHCGLIHMNEPCVLENSRLRFLADAIYTLVGTILIAINPFANIAIYGYAGVPSPAAAPRRAAPRC